MKKMMKIQVLFLLLSGILYTQALFAQQLPGYSQYTMNEFLFNPSIAGADGYSAINLVAREQWLGIPNAPRTHALSFQTRLLPSSFIFKGTSIKRRRTPMSRDSRIGIGGFIYNDRTGLLDRTGIQISYAYHIPMDESQLSFGLSTNFYQFKVKDGMVLDNDFDQIVDASREAMYIPDVNFGVYYLTGRYYAGFSATDLAQSALKIKAANAVNYKQVRHYYLVGGYKYRVNYDLVLEPNSLIKASEDGAVQMDLGLRAHFNGEFWAGLSYRTKNTLIVMGGVNVDKFYFGYAFDFSFSDLQQYTYGTHEFMASVKFGQNVRRYRWLNKF